MNFTLLCDPFSKPNESKINPCITDLKGSHNEGFIDSWFKKMYCDRQNLKSKLLSHWKKAYVCAKTARFVLFQLFDVRNASKVELKLIFNNIPDRFSLILAV